MEMASHADIYKYLKCLPLFEVEIFSFIVFIDYLNWWSWFGAKIIALVESGGNIAKHSKFEHTKTFFWQFFYHFFVTFMKNAFLTISSLFLRQNAHVVNKSFLLIVKYSKIKLIKTFFPVLVQKQFSGTKFDQKKLQKAKLLFQKICWVIF